MKLLSTGLVAASLLSGCAATTNARVTPSAVNYNKVIENTSNELLLMNIVRASKRQPLYFTRIGGITRADQMQARVGLTGTLPQRGANGFTSSETLNSNGSVVSAAGETFARAVDTLTPNASASYSSSPTFNIEILDTHEFYQGILKPLELDAFYQYVRQGWNPNQLAMLTVESIIFKTEDYEIKFDNDPDDAKDIEVFRQLMSCADIKKIEKTYNKSAQFELNDVKDADSVNKLSTLIEKETWALEAFSDTTAYVNYKKVPEIGIKANFSKCWNDEKYPVLVKYVEAKNNAHGVSIRDKNGNLVNLPKTAEFLSSNGLGGSEPKDGFTTEAVMRSTHGIIYYLGECLRGNMKQSGYDQPCYFEDDGVKKYVSNFQQGGERGLVSTNMYGDRFYIPDPVDTNTDRTLQTLAYLNQLINLNKKGSNAFSSAPIIAFAQ